MNKLIALVLTATLLFQSAASSSPCDAEARDAGADCGSHLVLSDSQEASCPICGGSIEDLKAIVAMMLDMQIEALIRFGGV